MGALYHFDLQPWITKYNLVSYVETGGGLGTCLEWALKYPFERTYSVELDPEFSQELSRKFPLSHIINDYSTVGLESILRILPEDPCLFWHDAHFVGNPDHHKTTYAESIRENGQKSFPLEEELDILIARRDISKDVIIIDDLALYDANSNCEWCRAGNSFQYRDLCSQMGVRLNLEAITSKLSSSHSLSIDNRAQGYLIALPK